MMEVVPLRAFNDNYLWVLRQDGFAAVVDPGDAAPVERHLATTGDRLCAILITHRHHDHIGGIADLRSHRDIPVFGPRHEDIPGITHPLEGGETIRVPGMAIDLDVMDVAGHTCGHLAYYRPKVLLCGDTLFVLGCGRLFEGTPERMYASLQTLAALPPDTEVYSAHEYATMNLRFALAVEPDNPDLARRARHLRDTLAAGQPTVPALLADELATNPFLRCHVPAVARAAASHGKTDTPADVFATLRAWRNVF